MWVVGGGCVHMCICACLRACAAACRGVGFCVRNGLSGTGPSHAGYSHEGDSDSKHSWGSQSRRPLTAGLAFASRAARVPGRACLVLTSFVSLASSSPCPDPSLCTASPQAWDAAQVLSKRTHPGPPAPPALPAALEGVHWAPRGGSVGQHCPADLSGMIESSRFVPRTWPRVTRAI